MSSARTCLERGEKVSWLLQIQTMDQETASQVAFDPFDVTKIWPRGEFPMQEVGRLTLDRNPENYFRDVEQAAFSPGSLVPGIEASPDALLLWRLGVNLHQVPVNCPFMATSQNSDTVDGAMRVDENNKGKPQYMPNSFHSITAPLAKPETTETPMQFGSNAYSRTDHFRHRGQPSEYDQVRELWTRVMTDEERENTAKNTAFLLQTAESLVQTRYLAQCYAISKDYAQMIYDRLPEKHYHMEMIERQSKEAHLVNVEPRHTLEPSEKSKTSSFMGMAMPAKSACRFS